MGAGGTKYEADTFEAIQKYKLFFQRIGLRKKELKLLFYRFRKADALCLTRLERDNFIDFLG